MAHQESCKGCKKVFLKTLEKKFGEVVDQWSSSWPCRIDDVLNLSEMNKTTALSIKRIYGALQRYRGHDNFVGVHKLPKCDYYVNSLNCLVEIDESQHFTAPRGLSLSLYPKRRFRKPEPEQTTSCHLVCFVPKNPIKKKIGLLFIWQSTDQAISL